MTQSLQNKIEESIEHFNRDFFITKEKTYSTQTKNISEWFRDELTSIATLAQEEARKEILEEIKNFRNTENNKAMTLYGALKTFLS